MRICIDASNLARGGGVTHLLELLRQEAPVLGVQHVFVWGSRSVLSGIEEKVWLTKRHVPVLERGFLMRALWQRFRLEGHAKADGCDILFAPGGTVTSKFRPAVTMCRNMLPFDRSEILRYGVSLMTLRLLLLRWAQTMSFRAADGTIFLTRHARDVVTRQIGSLTGLSALVPHGVSPRFSGAPYLARAIESCSDQLPFRIVYVSIIDHYKHQDHVASAVISLRNKGLPVQLLLVGPAYPPARRRLERLLGRLDSTGRTVRLLGAMPHEQLPAVYAEADLAVFASSCENMPNILLEMMCAGLPIACSNRGPMPDILGESEYFDPESPDEIAAAIERMILRPDLRARLAVQARIQAKQFSWRRCAEETYSFLGGVVRRSKADIR